MKKNSIEIIHRDIIPALPGGLAELSVDALEAVAGGVDWVITINIERSGNGSANGNDVNNGDKGNGNSIGNGSGNGNGNGDEIDKNASCGSKKEEDNSANSCDPSIMCCP